MDIYITAPATGHRAELSFGGQTAACALGKAGVAELKREGDGATPLGRFALRKVWYRPDREPRPDTALETRAIAEHDGWSDDPTDPAYNRRITRPHPFGREKLWRQDGLYDLFIEIGVNDDPPVAGRGSALFLHLTPDFSPTRGCVAVARDTMLQILAGATPDSHIVIASVE